MAASPEEEGNRQAAAKEAATRGKRLWPLGLDWGSPSLGYAGGT